MSIRATVDYWKSRCFVLESRLRQYEEEIRRLRGMTPLSQEEIDLHGGVSMDLDKEAFKFGTGDKFLKLIFTLQTAQMFINNLTVAIRPKEENGQGKKDFYYCVAGSCIPIP